MARSAALALQASLVERRRGPKRRTATLFGARDDAAGGRSAALEAGPPELLAAAPLYGAPRKRHVRYAADGVLARDECARAVSFALLAARRARRQGGKCSLGLGDPPRSASSRAKICASSVGSSVRSGSQTRSEAPLRSSSKAPQGGSKAPWRNVSNCP